MTTHRDPVSTLSALRPQTTVDDLWPAVARAAARERVLTDTLSAARTSRARPRTTRRLVAVVGTLAAVAAGVIVLPSLTGGDRAFASWTPAPERMSPGESFEAAAGCRRVHEDGLADTLGSAQPVIAERRGVWTMVVLAGSDGFTGLCISDDSALFFREDVIGSAGTSGTVAGPRELVATDLGVGTMSAGEISLAAGTAGAEVTGIGYRSSRHGQVTATVAQGHFAFWLPSDELADAATRGVEVEVTYRDGSEGSARLSL